MDYQKQATDLLTKLNVKFSAKFSKHGKHFADDQETRDIFNLTLSRTGSRMSIQFGQSIASSTGNGSNPPTAYDLLSCLTKNDPGSFDNFCGDFGYDQDSRKAERTYKGVVKEWQKVEKFFSAEEIEQLQEVN